MHIRMPISSILKVSVCLISFVTATSLISCKKDDNNPPPEKIEFTATLNGQQETPPATTSATGTLTATYNTSTNELDYTLYWSGLTTTPVAMHFHKGKVGEAGDVQAAITGFPTILNGQFTGTATIEESEEEDLLENKFYVNIHTGTYLDGEIRGQLMRK